MDPLMELAHHAHGTRSFVRERRAAVAWCPTSSAMEHCGQRPVAHRFFAW